MRICAFTVVLLGACGSASQPGDLAAVSETALPPPDPCASTGSWRPIAPIELPGRVDHTAVWTGSEMLLWGGTRGTRSPLADGARYRPATDRWIAMSEHHGPIERDDHAAIWTGSEMIVWGGNHDSEKRDKLDSGGRYDPVADRWSPLPSSGLTARDDPRAVWTGSEMIVWGGRDSAGHTRDGARYSPSKDGWLAVSLRGAPEPREDHSAIWTGSEMIIWGGVRREPDRRQLATGGRYRPATDSWTPITLTGAPEAREDGVVVWTGTDLLVWGGQQGEVPLASGARYLASADTWCPIASDGAPDARRDHAGVWAGHELVVWGGRDRQGEYVASGAAFAP